MVEPDIVEARRTRSQRLKHIETNRTARARALIGIDRAKSSLASRFVPFPHQCACLRVAAIDAAPAVSYDSPRFALLCPHRARFVHRPSRKENHAARFAARNLARRPVRSRSASPVHRGAGLH
ncbi:hypothetical protein, partial [Burkholderia multivorans]|uniref:hypothetical protein n=1 Tax=Burkholderia multivorans TaxID=87883 RepID=UPI001EE692D3